MLIFVGLTTEVTGCGSCHMLVFQSPHLPGTHYRVETDAGTVGRLQAIISSEAAALMAAAAQADEDEGELRDPSGRL